MDGQNWATVGTSVPSGRVPRPPLPKIDHLENRIESI